MISYWRSTSGPEIRLMLLLIFGMICFVAGQALSAEPEHKYDGVYTGKRSLAKGAASTTCPAEDEVSVTITGETLTFTNSALKKYTMPLILARMDHSAKLTWMREVALCIIMVV
jgi:hypothetical protein